MYTHLNQWGMILLLAATGAALGQAGPASIKGVPMDWSRRHVVFSNPGTEAEAVENGTVERWLKIAHDPRYAMQRLAPPQPLSTTDDLDPSPLPGRIILTALQPGMIFPANLRQSFRLLCRLFILKSAVRG